MKSYKFHEPIFGIETPSILLVVALSIVFVSCPMSAPGQSAVGNTGKQIKSTKTTYGSTPNQFSKLVPAIERHTDRLSKIYAKYSEEEPSNPGPFWQRLEIWNDLIRSRQSMRQEYGANLTRRQRAQLDVACFQLERETLSLLLDDEVPYWAELLELTPRQFEAFFRLVNSDVKSKHSFLQRLQDKNLLDQKLKLISEATERKLNKLLLDDQREIWEKAKQESTRAGIKLLA